MIVILFSLEKWDILLNYFIFIKNSDFFMTLEKFSKYAN